MNDRVSRLDADAPLHVYPPKAASHVILQSIVHEQTRAAQRQYDREMRWQKAAEHRFLLGVLAFIAVFAVIGVTVWNVVHP